MHRLILRNGRLLPSSSSSSSLFHSPPLLIITSSSPSASSSPSPSLPLSSSRFFSSPSSTTKYANPNYRPDLRPKNPEFGEAMEDSYTPLFNDPYPIRNPFKDDLYTVWRNQRIEEQEWDKKLSEEEEKDPNNIDNDVTITGTWRAVKLDMYEECYKQLGGESFKNALKEARATGDGKKEKELRTKLTEKTIEYLKQKKVNPRTINSIDTNEEWIARKDRVLKNHSWLDWDRFQSYMQFQDDMFWWEEDDYMDTKAVTAPNSKLFEGQERELLKRRLFETDVRKVGHLLPEWWVIDEGRHVKRTAKGKIESFSCMVIAGDGNGMAGWSVGKANMIEDAREKAVHGIKKNLMFLPLTESRTITMKVVGKHEKTQVHMYPRPNGFGMTAGFIQFAIFNCFGIQDISAKVHGNNHPRHQVWATFEGLARQKSLREMAINAGSNVYNMFRWNPLYKPRPPSHDEMKERRKEVRELITRMRDENVWANPRLDDGYVFDDYALKQSDIKSVLASRYFKYYDWLASIKSNAKSQQDIDDAVAEKEKELRPLKEEAFVRGYITKEQLDTPGLPEQLESKIKPHPSMNAEAVNTILRSSLRNIPTSPLNQSLDQLYKGRDRSTGLPKK